MNRGIRFNPWIIVLAVLAAAAAPPAFAQRVKEPLDHLDNLVFAQPELRVVETTADAEAIRARVPDIGEIDLFRAENGEEWRALLDQRRGVPALLDGGAIPFIPGPANDLGWESLGSCREAACIPVKHVEDLAREFLARYPGLLGADPRDLVLDTAGSLAVGDSVYLLRFQWTHRGIPVEGGSVYFRINNGNLIQVATSRIGPIGLDPVPAITAETAWENLAGYLGRSAPDGKDEILERGRLLILPVTPRGEDPNVFNGRFGGMID